MYITRIKLVNWKNFRKAECKLSPRTFITGANAAGKSNLLDAIRFLRDIARKKGGGLQEAISIRGGVSKIRSLAARQNPLIEIEVGIGDADVPEQFVYSIGIRQENKGKRRVMLAYERVQQISDGRMILNRPTKEDKRDDEQLTLTYLESPTTNRRFRKLADVFGSVSYLHLVPQLLRSVQSAENEQPGEDYYGKNFLVRLTSTPERTRKARLRRILDALATAVPQFDGLKDDKDKAGVPHLLLRLKHWRPDAGWQDESQFSDGTIRMIGLFWSMLEGDTILLFEEPELSLNDKIVEQLPGLLWKLQVSSGRQAILSTHSNALLSDMSIAPEEVALLESGAEGTTVQIAADMPEIMAMYENGMSIGDAILPRTAPPSVTDLTL